MASAGWSRAHTCSRTAGWVRVGAPKGQLAGPHAHLRQAGAQLLQALVEVRQCLVGARRAAKHHLLQLRVGLPALRAAVEQHAQRLGDADGRQEHAGPGLRPRRGRRQQGGRWRNLTLRVGAATSRGEVVSRRPGCPCRVKSLNDPHLVTNGLEQALAKGVDRVWQ